jgi:hypothetical protein
MSFGDQNKRTTRPIDSEYLEELASQSARAGVEPNEPLPSGPRAASSGRMPRIDERGSLPTCKMDPNELIGLLGEPDPSTASAPADDFMTRRMEAGQFQALLQSSQAPGAPQAPLSPRPPEQHAATVMPALPSTTRSGEPRSGEPQFGEEHAQRVIRHPIDLSRPSARSAGVRILIGLLVVALVSALVGHTIFDAIVELVNQS